MKVKYYFLLMFIFLGFAQETLAQTKSVKGIVTSASDKTTLPGVSVIIQGTQKGTQTDFDGKYTINASEGDVLVFSYLGFTSKNVTVTKSNTVNVTLNESAEQLDAVVITALGIKKQKKSLTYSTQNVEEDDLAKSRSVNVLNGLSGKVAGLSITPGGSGVGSGTKVLLRGNRSINGSSQPLYVVDGILLDGDISNISPNDIATISVLKGANAAALYGSRANNGAIIITTKSGKGKSGITTSIGYTTTVETAIHLLDFQNEYGQGSKGVYSPNAVVSWGPSFDGAQVAHWSNDPNNPNFGSTYAYNAQPNNVADFFRAGHNSSTNLSVNVNNDNSNVYLGYTFTDAEGIIPDNNLDRHNITARINAKITEKLSVDSKVDYIRDNLLNDVAQGGNFDNPLRYLYQIPRNIRTQDIANYEYINDQGRTRQHYYRPGNNGSGNPYWTLNKVRNPRLKDRVLGLLSLKYDITEDLSVTGRSTIDRTNVTAERKWHSDTYLVAQNGRYEKSSSSRYDWNTDFLLNYKKELNEDFKLSANIGANHRSFKATSLRADGNTFTTDNFFALSNTLNPTISETFSQFETQSVYGLFELAYKNAIFLNVTGRNDWSSTLPKANRSFFYPSVGLTAVVSDLAKLPELVNFLKVRGSWAEVGNDTNPFLLSRRADVVAGTLNLNPTLPNADLRPESTNSLEFGFNTRLLDNRLKLDFTWYQTNTTDQLFRSPVPVGTLVSNVFQNGADVQNKGIEITLGGTVMKKEDFSWDIDVNFSKNESEILELADGFDVLTLTTDAIRSYRIEKGGEFGDVYTRGFVRDDQGRVIVGANGVPKVTRGFTVKAANFNPDWLAGVRTSFSYKNFSLSALVDIRQGGTIVSSTEATLAESGVLAYTAQGRDGSLVFGDNFFGNETAVTEAGDVNNISVDAEDFWNSVGGRNNPIGEPFIRDASNVRLREVIFGYKVPQSFLDKTFLTSANISLTGRNLFFFSNKAGMVDPEIVQNTSNSSEGRESFSPPTTRSIGMSLNLSF